MNLNGDELYAVDVFGESKYQNELDMICGGKTPNGHSKVVKATLTVEANDYSDDKILRVAIEGKTIGIVKGNDSLQHCKMLEKIGKPNLTTTCSALIVGGWDDGEGDTGFYGVKLDLPTAAKTTKRKCYELPQWVIAIIEKEGKKTDGPATVIGSAVNLWSQMPQQQKETAIRIYNDKDFILPSSLHSRNLPPTPEDVR